MDPTIQNAMAMAQTAAHSAPVKVPTATGNASLDPRRNAEGLDRQQLAMVLSQWRCPPRSARA